METKHFDEVRNFAIAAHGDQKYTMEPYVFHLDDVYNILVEFNIIDLNILIAAYLHDVLEDTLVTFYEIENIFGSEVADITYAVTDKHGKNRAERHRNTYPSIALSKKATILKIADRIANTRRSVGRDIYKMYKKEYPYFKEILYSDDVVTEKMWAELDRLMEV